LQSLTIWVSISALSVAVRYMAACGGQVGAAPAIEILPDEITVAMTMIGIRSFAEPRSARQSSRK
jgi:isopentenyl diphosphate isomerase/L-lactate dehydrogenase-like FMN-dependent dehydrogenase